MSWESICAKLGARTSGHQPIVISIEEHENLLLALERTASLKTVARQVASWRDEPVAHRLERIRKQLQVLSRKMGKGEADVVTEAGNLRLPSHAFAEFWDVLAHVVRNVVDHGFQTAEERVAAGKSPENRLGCELPNKMMARSS